MYCPLAHFPAALQPVAAHIRLACFDVDGTLTDGRLYYDELGHESKAFCSVDGLGLKLLQHHGIEPVIITARHSVSAAKRGADLGIQTQVGVGDKLANVRVLCQERNIGLQQVAFMGDDLPDLSALQSVGLAVAPANAHPVIIPYVHWITRASAGLGAARELCDVLLAVQGKQQAVLAQFSA